MAQRIFEIEKDYTESAEANHIVFIDENDISVEYNVYKCYQKNDNYEENLAEYEKEKNEYIEHEKSQLEELNQETEEWELNEADVTPELLAKWTAEFDEDFEYYASNEFRYSGMPTKGVLCEDEDFVGDDSDYFDDEDCTISASSQSYEYYSFWDGHNHKKIYLDSDINQLITEVTDDFCQEDEMEIFGQNRNNFGGYHFAYDKENKKFLRYNWSAYQGTEASYEVIEPCECLLVLAEIENDEILELIKEDFKEYQLLAGEALEITDEKELLFTYRNEEYHYSTEELTDHDGSFCLDFKIARNAIRERRLTEVTDKFAKNGYEKVLELPLKKIFVTYDDSIQSGNCEEHSEKFKNEVAAAENISGEYALRADIMLQYRNDNYTRRAILRSYKYNYTTI